MDEEEYAIRRFREARPFEDGHGLRGPSPEMHGSMTQGATGIPHSQQVDIPDPPAATSAGITGATQPTSNNTISDAIVMVSGTLYYADIPGTIKGPV